MQSSIIRSNQPFPDDMALFLFSKVIRKLSGVNNTHTKDIKAADVEEKIRRML